MMEAKKIRARFDACASQRYTVDQTWEIIKDLMMPFRSRFFTTSNSEHEVEWRKNRNVFDSTAVMGITTLASSLHGSLTSPAIKWFDFKFRDPELNRDQEAKEWLEAASKSVYDALQDSNFNIEINEAYIDLVGFGTSVIVEEYETKDGAVDLAFQAVPIEQCYFEQDHKGQVNTLYRRYRWTATQIISKFGDKTPERFIKEAESTSSIDRRHDIIFCIFPRKNKQDNAKETVLAASERPIGYKYVIHASGEQIGDEGGYYEMPAFVPRWRKTAGSMWGHSPAMIALPDVLTLNRLVELILISTEKVVDPAIITTERGLISDVDLGAGGLTVLRNIDDMKPFESRARFDVSELQRDALQQSIRSIFHVDQLELKNSPAMTATEVQVRYELMQRILGPTLGRLRTDLLDPTVDRTFHILLREGVIPPPPESVANADATMDVDYVGPLSRAQKTDTAMSIERWVGNIAQLAEVKPEILDIPNWDEMTIALADILNVPASLRNGDAEVKTIREERSKKQAEERKVAMAQAQGDAMKSQGEGQQALEQQ